MHLNETKFLADVPVPAGVTIPELSQRNAPVVSIHAPRAEEPEPVAAEAVAAVPVEGALRRALPERRRPLALPEPPPLREMPRRARRRRKRLPPRRKAARSSRPRSYGQIAVGRSRKCRFREQPRAFPV